jgi:hypothetical protein
MELVAALLAVVTFRFLDRVALPFFVKTVEDITEELVEGEESSS